MLKIWNMIMHIRARILIHVQYTVTMYPIFAKFNRKTIHVRLVRKTSTARTFVGYEICQYWYFHRIWYPCHFFIRYTNIINYFYVMFGYYGRCVIKHVNESATSCMKWESTSGWISPRLLHKQSPAYTVPCSVENCRRWSGKHTSYVIHQTEQRDTSNEMQNIRHTLNKTLMVGKQDALWRRGEKSNT